MIASVWDVVALVVGYAAATLGAGWVIGAVLPEPTQRPPRLTPAGRVPVPMLIGWLERFLIVTFVLAGETVAIGFVIVAKSIVRFGETRDDREFAEYVLCGTLASVSAGLVLALATKWLVGQV